jgi:dihydropyrimidinase
MGRDAFTRIPNGIPSVENRVDLLYTKGVCEGRIGLNDFVDAASTRAARIFGLKGKGTIAVGVDADLVVYDPGYRGTISSTTHSAHHMATDYSAFEGWEVKGRSDTVTVRGRVKVRDGNFVGSMGSGRLVPRA